MLNSVRKHQLGGEPPKPRKKPVYRESNAQRLFVDWLRKRPNWKVTRIENEGKRTPAQTARAKAMGMTPGDPDLLVIYRVHLFWIEMKAKGGRVSDAQENVHAELSARKQTVLTAWSFDEAVAIAEEIEHAYPDV